MHATENESSLFNCVASMLHRCVQQQALGKITLGIIMDHMTNTACDNLEIPLAKGLILPFLRERLEAKAFEYYQHQKDKEQVSFMLM